MRPLATSTVAACHLCMLVSLSIHLYGLHLDAQYGQT